jgi:pyridoxamine 5'-phosphate oxidase
MQPLVRDQLHPSPFVQFTTWFQDAKRTLGIRYADAFCLSTIDPDGFPNGRMLLLKQHSEQGFVFYTNQHSVKGKSLAAVPKAAMTFYWDPLRRQVRIQGSVSEVSAADADEYFSSRPREAQAGAWASLQSEVMEERSALEQRVAEVLRQYEDRPIPRPAHWSGYVLTPQRMEFWQERPFRLHDRFVYLKRAPGRWQISELFP